MVDLKKRIDIASWTDDLNRVRAVDLRYNVDGFVEIAGAHGPFFPFPYQCSFPPSLTGRNKAQEKYCRILLLSPQSVFSSIAQF